MSLVSGITALQITGGDSKVYSNLSATQADNITFQGANSTQTTFNFATNTSADSITFNLASTTATTNVDVIGIDVDNIETVTFNATTGTNTSGDTAISFLANKADEVTAINITGTADTTLTVAANTLDVVAVTINASGLTGDGDFTLTQTSNLVTGSTVTGTANADTIAMGTTLGSTYNGGAGNDGFTGTVALLVADGSGDTIVNGGDGEDTLTISTAAPTLTDNHFTNLSNLEKLTLSGSDDTSVTVGSAFNSAFPSGATITQAGKDNDGTLTYAFGIASVPVTIALTTAVDGSDNGEAHSITTGSGADTITVTASSFASYAGADATITISSGSGNDTITYTTGTLGDVAATSQAVTITAGTGQDNITKTGTNGNDAETTSSFVFAAGDSTTTAYDIITGYDVTAAGDMADELDFAGTAAVGTLGTSTNFGTILSHSISNGFASFDDAAAHASALNITSSNLSDVVGYLAANTSTNDVVAFAFDSDSNGSADATMVYHNGSTDSLVLLAGISTADAVVTTNSNGADNDIFVL
jgi:hypothetical protein